MAGETIITVVGNLTADPEVRTSEGSGRQAAKFTIASTPRTFDRQANEWKDGDALFLQAVVWGDMAEHVAATLTKGLRVVAQGRLQQRSFEHKGEKRTVIELVVDEIGPSLRYATAQVTRRQGGGGRAQQQAPQQGGGWGAPAPQQDQGWATAQPGTGWGS